MNGYEQAMICPHCWLDKSPPLYDPRPLTLRMVKVLDLLCAGLTNEEIAARLYVSHASVRDTIRQCYQRLGVDNRVRAAVAWTTRRADYMRAVDAMHDYMRGKKTPPPPWA